jgi:hypothetical protein
MAYRCQTKRHQISQGNKATLTTPETEGLQPGYRSNWTINLVGRQFTHLTEEEKMKIIFTAVALITALSFAPAWALFETDKQLSEKARVSMIDALKTAEGVVPGKAVEVNMGKDDGKVVYKIEIIDAAKKRATSTLMQNRGRSILPSNSTVA